MIKFSGFSTTGPVLPTKAHTAVAPNTAFFARTSLLRVEHAKQELFVRFGGQTIYRYANGVLIPHCTIPCLNPPVTFSDYQEVDLDITVSGV